jgi:hypothetical protein
MGLQQRVHVIGLFHEDHVSGSVEQVNRRAGKVGGVAHGNDLVFLAPDHLRITRPASHRGDEQV